MLLPEFIELLRREGMEAIHNNSYIKRSENNGFRALFVCVILHHKGIDKID